MQFVAAFLLGLALALAQGFHGGALVPAQMIVPYLLVCAAALAALVAVWKCDAGVPLGLAALVTATFAYLLWRVGQGGDLLIARNAFALFLAGLAVWAMVAAVLVDRASRLVLLAALAVAVAANAALGVYQLAFDWEGASYFGVPPELRALYLEKFAGRLVGTYLNPNHFAWPMNAAAVLCLSLSVWARVGPAARVLALYFAAMFAVVVVLSGSRGAMLGLAAALLAFACAGLAAVVANRHFMRWPLVAVACAVAVVVVGAGAFAYRSSWQVQGRVGSIGEVDDVRSYLNEHALRLFQVEPMTGSGPGAFLYAAREYRRGYQDSDAVFAHNDWLQLAAEYGFVGFALVLLSLGALLWNGFFGALARFRDSAAQTGASSDTGAALALGASCALVAFAVHSLVDFNMHLPANALLACALGGLAILPRSKSGASAIGGQLLATVAMAASAVALGFWLRQNAEPEYRYARAKAALDRRSLAEARREARRGLDLGLPHPELQFVYARALIENSPLGLGSGGDQWQIDPVAPSESQSLHPMDAEAIRALESAVALRPLERRYRVYLAIAQSRSGDRVSALEHLRAAIAADPAHAFVYTALGDHYDDAGQTRAALRWYTQAARMPGGDFAAEMARLLSTKLIRESRDPNPPANEPASETDVSPDAGG